MVAPVKSRLEVWILAVLCGGVLGGILVAGLWPFHPPTNQITWLQNANGLRFGDHGTVVSSGAFSIPTSQDEASWSLEIWLRPGLADDSNTILAFYTPGNPMQFSLHQSATDLALRNGSPNEHLRSKGAAVAYVDEIFGSRKLLFIAIASGVQGTRIYVDGILARTVPHLRLSSKDFTGQLVLGTSPVVNDTWSGQLRGLAIYSQELTAAEVSRHFETWTIKGRPDVGQNERVVALYLFDEHQGNTVHDRSGSGRDLYIPERYMVLREKFLEPPWEEWYAGWSYWKNVGINIGGFIPLGFFFCAYLTLARQLSRPALAAIILGAAVSVTIEVLQAFLPTRDSGVTDIITNTLGTCLGVVLFRWKAALLRQALNRIAFATFRMSST
jgi:hypothetical protein